MSNAVNLKKEKIEITKDLLFNPALAAIFSKLGECTVCFKVFQGAFKINKWFLRERKKAEVERQMLLGKYSKLDKEGKPEINKDGMYNLLQDKAKEFGDDYKKTFVESKIELDAEKLSVESFPGLVLSPREWVTVAPFFNMPADLLVDDEETIEEPKDETQQEEKSE